MVSARDRLLPLLAVPRCARELTEHTGIPIKTVQSTLRRCAHTGLVRCVTPAALQSRLYQLTALGEQWAREVHGETAISATGNHDPRTLTLRAWVQAGKYRRHLLAGLVDPLTPRHLRKRVLSSHPFLRMGINHVRRTLRALRDAGLVWCKEGVWICTPVGEHVRSLGEPRSARNAGASTATPEVSAERPAITAHGPTRSGEPWTPCGMPPQHHQPDQSQDRGRPKHYPRRPLLPRHGTPPSGTP